MINSVTHVFEHIQQLMHRVFKLKLLNIMKCKDTYRLVSTLHYHFTESIKDATFY